MDEDRLSSTDEGNVGSSWKVGSMDAVSIAQGVDESADKEFRIRVFSPNSRHEGASRWRRRQCIVIHSRGVFLYVADYLLKFVEFFSLPNVIFIRFIGIIQ